LSHRLGCCPGDGSTNSVVEINNRLNLF
jgi:hypothetical protein